MDWYSEIKLKGFYHFNDPEVFPYLKTFYYAGPMVKYEKVKYPILYYPVGKMLLRATQIKLKKKYLSEFKTTSGNVDAWRGIDNLTDQWHNDIIEGYNTAFLMYLSDMDESTGGGIQFKRTDSNKIHTVYPKKYDIIVMNQSEIFRHRVLPLVKQINRDTANIEFNIIEE